MDGLLFISCLLTSLVVVESFNINIQTKDNPNWKPEKLLSKLLVAIPKDISEVSGNDTDPFQVIQQKIINDTANFIVANRDNKFYRIKIRKKTTYEENGSDDSTNTEVSGPLSSNEKENEQENTTSDTSNSQENQEYEQGTSGTTLNENSFRSTSNGNNVDKNNKSDVCDTHDLKYEVILMLANKYLGLNITRKDELEQLKSVLKLKNERFENENPDAVSWLKEHRNRYNIDGFELDGEHKEDKSDENFTSDPNEINFDYGINDQSEPGGYENNLSLRAAVESQNYNNEPVVYTSDQEKKYVYQRKTADGHTGHQAIDKYLRSAASNVKTNKGHSSKLSGTINIINQNNPDDLSDREVRLDSDKYGNNQKQYVKINEDYDYHDSNSRSIRDFKNLNRNLNLSDNRKLNQEYLRNTNTVEKSLKKIIEDENISYQSKPDNSIITDGNNYETKDLRNSKKINGNNNIYIKSRTNNQDSNSNRLQDDINGHDSSALSLNNANYQENSSSIEKYPNNLGSIPSGDIVTAKNLMDLKISNSQFNMTPKNNIVYDNTTSNKSYAVDLEVSAKTKENFEQPGDEYTENQIQLIKPINYNYYSNTVSKKIWDRNKIHQYVKRITNGSKSNTKNKPQRSFMHESYVIHPYGIPNVPLVSRYSKVLKPHLSLIDLPQAKEIYPGPKIIVKKVIVSDNYYPENADSDNEFQNDIDSIPLHFIQTSKDRSKRNRRTLITPDYLLNWAGPVLSYSDYESPLDFNNLAKSIQKNMLDLKASTKFVKGIFSKLFPDNFRRSSSKHQNLNQKAKNSSSSEISYLDDDNSYYGGSNEDLDDSFEIDTSHFKSIECSSENPVDTSNDYYF